jgi:transcriptional regulator NrdR family protein
MKCPLCGHESRILRTTDRKRRRECLHCRHRWGTVEIPESDERRLAAAVELAKAVLQG